MRSFAFMLLSALAFVNLAFMLPIVARKQLFQISTAAVSKGSNESNTMELQSSQKQAYHVKTVNSELISEAASSGDSLRINVELAQRSELQHKKIKARRIKSKRLLAAKGVEHSEERLLMVDQVDYESARTHPPTKPPRNN